MSIALDAHSSDSSSPSGGVHVIVFGRQWLRGVVRIVFGVLCAVDAAFKWSPGFIEGQTLPDELGKATDVRWLLLNTPDRFTAC